MNQDHLSRRAFVRGSIGVAAAALAGCGEARLGPAAGPSDKPRPAIEFPGTGGEWAADPPLVRRGRLIRFARPKDGPARDGWLFEWDLAGAAQGKGLAPMRLIHIAPTGGADIACVQPAGERMIVACAGDQVVRGAVGAGGRISQCSLEPRASARPKSLLVSRSGQWSLWIDRDGTPCLDQNSGEPGASALKKVAVSKKWRELLEPQACEIHYPECRFYLSDDGNTVVRAPYIWRWDESGFADEYPMLLVYDIAKSTLAEHIIRVGEKSKLVDLAWIDGQVWMQLVVERSGKRTEQVVTDLKRSATLTVKPAENPEEPWLWDVEGQRLVRVQPIEGSRLPATTGVEIHELRAGKVVRFAVEYRAG